jgi:hypothetical protein
VRTLARLDPAFKSSETMARSALGQCERRPAEVERLASHLIELSARHNFLYWQAVGNIRRGWARSAAGNSEEGIP